MFSASRNTRRLPVSLDPTRLFTVDFTRPSRLGVPSMVLGRPALTCNTANAAWLTAIRPGLPCEQEIFCAILGNGAQILCIAVGVLFLACLGVYSHYNRGALFVAALLIFALTSGVNGYMTGSFYAKLQGEQWVWALVCSYFLFLGPFFLTCTFLNSVAWGNNSSTALPFGTIVIIILILTLVSFPLLVVGGITGRNFATPFEAPCRTTKIPREIPSLPWHRQAAFQARAPSLASTLTL